MNKGLKYGLLIFGFAIIVLMVFVAFGLYTMEIEDHYGDYQEVYYVFQDGDIIVNEETSQLGIVGKNWKRLNIWTKEKDSTDLYFFAIRKSHNSTIKIYQPQTEIKGIKQMEFESIKELITEKKIKLILEYPKE